jgi:nucleoid-associated protein YgaU
MFTPRSRYAAVADATYQGADGRAVTYKTLRITPAANSIQSHTVAQGDRLDLIAFQKYGDAEQFWRICDGNDALRPDDLTLQAGARIRLPNVQR